MSHSNAPKVKHCPTFSSIPRHLSVLQFNQIMLDVTKKRKENWVKFRRKFSGWGTNTISYYTFSVTHSENTLTSSSVWTLLSLCNSESLYYYGNFSQGEFFSSACFAYRFLFSSIAIYISSFMQLTPARSHRSCYIKTLSFSLWCSSVLLISKPGVDSLLCRFHCFKFQIEIRKMFDKLEIF